MPHPTMSKITFFELAAAMLTFVFSVAVVASLPAFQATLAPNPVQLLLGFTFGTFLTMICGTGGQLVYAVTARHRVEPERRAVWLPPLGALATFFVLAVLGFVWVMNQTIGAGSFFGIGSLVGAILAETGIIRIGKKKCIVAPNPAIAEFASMRIYLGDPQQVKQPHVIAETDGIKVTYSLGGEVVEGSIPHENKILLEAWLELRGKELLKNWRLLEAGQKTFKIAGLE
ncbi:DUF4160 domain-containing protein [Geomesophilobacter sediminis]|uniref:DUF4160 domain-containing protein n=1 Tax=Geomesophilobacter sediminis TaxID=2798584 RepID=A0A8J7M3E4_9BACT|nr:DUF4160 domain-containing protein [Geomesophilobacter sediminis]MBJ6727913.1 DUF4160 domain-containing protein [Geomesophilobacter sediminis]